MESRLTALVRGYVQGVGYRWFARQRAQALGLSGYARNEADGSVQVIAEGERRLLERYLAELHRGPEEAEVSDIEVGWSVATGEFHGFQIRR